MELPPSKTKEELELEDAVLKATKLVEDRHQEKDDLLRKTHYLWSQERNHFFYVDYHCPEKGNIIVECWFVQVADGQVKLDERETPGPARKLTAW
jgi:hypothetical protein